MRLGSLLPLIRREAGYAQLGSRLAASISGSGPPVPGPGSKLTTRGTPLRFAVLDAAKPAVLAALHGELGQPTILLVGRLARARQLAEEIAAWSEDPSAIYLFPELDALPYERLAPGPEHLYERLRAMLALCTREEGPGATGHGGPRRPPAGRAPLVVVTARAAMDRLMPPGACRAATWWLRVGDQIRPDRLVGEWVTAGYEPVSVVEGPGEFARRGGIIDIFPCGSEPQIDAPNRRHPFRIELWGNGVGSIRTFDPATQRSTDTVEQILLGPAHEVLSGLPPGAEEALSALDFSRTRPRIRDQIENEIRMLRENQSFPFVEWYRGITGSACILDYVPAGGLLVVDEPGTIGSTIRELHRQAEELLVDLAQRGETPARVPRPYWTWDELEPRVTGDRLPEGVAPPSAAQKRSRRLDLVLDPDALDAAFTPAPSYSGRLPELVDRVCAVPRVAHPGAATGGAEREAPDSGPIVVIISQQAARLADVLGMRIWEPPDENLLTRPEAPPASALSLDSSVLLVHGVLGEGWANQAIGLTVLTDREIFGWAKVRRPARHLGLAARERFLSEIEPGELVVHVDHGIGRYRGLIRLADRTTGGEREYLDVEYAENARLRVPAEHADRLARYIGSGEAMPGLTRLGSGEWQRTKLRIRSAVRRIARELVELYAKRELAEAPPLGPDSPWQMELEASFPYLETPDQLNATAEVKGDLERRQPMDRLLVGDVGYGKTEVALRAAFKAVTAGRQVGVLVPTTVLAQQHLNTFRERLAPFPVRVEMLSRFLTDRQAREVIQGLKDGKVDIVVGTHRLLQGDVGFKDLGLVVIDEEQRFGVAHKERFKQLRTEVHVLTLSATPIPRTLHLSLVGVRDLSMIQTPPEERLPIRTYVTEHDDRLVREAILREIDRGGQVYYVSNRVYSIRAVAARLSALVPEARVAVAHGQMGDDELEESMLRFANGDADVLVCTTIIEAGLDLPNVNTIIVTNADEFGLSQLYQLRGRVGRGSNRAYAYFLYPWDRPLTEIAEKRLRAIFEATELGAGYGIALKDLEIRGAGNLLGVEQHGHISAVGFDLYCRLLGEAVEQLRALRERSLSPDGIAESVLSGAIQETQTATVDLPIAASIPEDYVADESARLNLYQRLASLRDERTLGELVSEIEDRFGPLPEQAMSLFYILSLRLAATRAGVEEIFVDRPEIVIRFRAPRSFDVAALAREVGVPVRPRANQVRIPLGRGGAWMPKLRGLVDRLEPVSSPERRGDEEPRQTQGEQLASESGRVADGRRPAARGLRPSAT